MTDARSNWNVAVAVVRVNAMLDAHASWRVLSNMVEGRHGFPRRLSRRAFIDAVVAMDDEQFSVAMDLLRGVHATLVWEQAVCYRRRAIYRAKFARRERRALRASIRSRSIASPR